MKTIGRHVIAELYGCASDTLNSIDDIRTFMRQAAELVGATVVGETFHRFAPQGISGSIVIAESHLSIHTWPESGYVSVDIYTCGGLDPHPGIRHLSQVLDAKSVRVQEILRGLPEELNAQQEICADDVQIMSRITNETPVSAFNN